MEGAHRQINPPSWRDDCTKLIFSGYICSTEVYRGRTLIYNHPRDFLAHFLPLFWPKPAELSQKAIQETARAWEDSNRS